ncbi:MAG: c-type cytochrome [Alphaproteobacteria bacterium]|nr:c-type cytochrome [Alphaproteobacteria bacterium]
MKPRMAHWTKAIFGALVLLAVIGVARFGVGAVAQTPEQGLQSGIWDRWNPGWMERHMWDPNRMGPGMQQRMARHWRFMHQGTPPSYRGARNPLAGDAKTIAEGRDLYVKNCSRCHGLKGTGDGNAANSLNPSPALLAYMIQMPMLIDEYMLWSIAEGGKAFGTPMPAFEKTLARDQIWKIVLFMRQGFPGGATPR